MPNRFAGRQILGEKPQRAAERLQGAIDAGQQRRVAKTVVNHLPTHPLLQPVAFAAWYGKWAQG